MSFERSPTLKKQNYARPSWKASAPMERTVNLLMENRSCVPLQICLRQLSVTSGPKENVKLANLADLLMAMKI